MTMALSRKGRRMIQAMSNSPVRFDTVFMRGGLDQRTSLLKLPPGFVRDAQNYEIDPVGGYSRVEGYERYSGKTKPSNATYALIQVTAFTNVPSVGATLTGATSGATGVIIALSQSGLYLVLTAISGTFTTSEVVRVGATTIGTATTQTVTITAKEQAQYTNAAADHYRTLIAAVPGSGPVRGVVHCVFSGVDHTYAFRDNSAGTLTILYESSTTGWTVVTLFNEISFTAGTTATAVDGDVLTQGGVTATIKRVVHQSGAWAGSAAGRFIIPDPTGGNFAAGAATCVGSGATVTLSGIQIVITLTTGGKYEFDRANFSGALNTRRLYGCDGVNRAFEFDGTVYVPITTGQSSDQPKHIREHKNHLFLAFQTSAIQSVVGKPYKYASADGAAEYAVGDTITNFVRQPGNQESATLEITCLEKTSMLYGLGVSTFVLVDYKEQVGAQHYSAQNIGRTYAMDRNGVVDLRAVQEYGNFELATLTYSIQTFINDKRLRLNYSSVHRGKSQYRLFFNDGTALYLTVVNGQSLGSMPMAFPHPVNVAYEGMLANGEEVCYVGAVSGGMVYELEKGSSFDGENIDAYFTLNWNAMKNPRQLKEFKAAVLEIQGAFYAAITVQYALGYGNSAIPQGVSTEYESNVAVSNWDEVNWDEFIWDGQTLRPTEAELRGTAENIQMRISSSTDYIMAYTIQSLICHYIPRRMMR